MLFEIPYKAAIENRADIVIFCSYTIRKWKRHKSKDTTIGRVCPERAVYQENSYF